MIHVADVHELNKYSIENKVKAMWREKQRVKASPWVILTQVLQVSDSTTAHTVQMPNVQVTLCQMPPCRMSAGANEHYRLVHL